MLFDNLIAELLIGHIMEIVLLKHWESYLLFRITTNTIWCARSIRSWVVFHAARNIDNVNVTCRTCGMMSRNELIM